MINLVFIRHGATQGNLEKRYVGCTDEPLCDLGTRQARSLRKYNFPSEHIFVSPMQRARQTAEIVFPHSKYTVTDDFRETDFGIFEGKSALELSEDKEYIAWVDSMCTLPIPKGEDIKGFKKRCTKAFRKIIETIPDGESASFVLHGGVIMAIMEEFCESGADFYDYHIGNGEFVICKFDGGKIKHTEF